MKPRFLKNSEIDLKIKFIMVELKKQLQYVLTKKK